MIASAIAAATVEKLVPSGTPAPAVIAVSQARSGEVTRRSRPRQISSQQYTTPDDSSSQSDVHYCPSRHTYRKRQHRHSSEGLLPKRKKRHRSRSTSSTSGSSSSGSSDSRAESATNLRRRHQRRHRRQGYRESQVAANMKKIAVSCYPPLPDKRAAKITKGQYVCFNKLLVPSPYKSKPMGDCQWPS